MKPEIRRNTHHLQRECYQALFDYWNKPKQQPLPAEAEADEEAIRIIANLYPP